MGAEKDDPLGVEASGVLIGESLYVALCDLKGVEVRNWKYFQTVYQRFRQLAFTPLG